MFAIPSAKSTPKKRSSDQAVCKFDLDHLGAFFREISEYDRKICVGQALDQAIKEALKKDPRIETVFAGGDDIFFLCPLESALSVIASFYRRLRNLLKKSEFLAEYAEHNFGISGGVCALRNQLDTIPFLSYFRSAENALATAKTKGKKNCVYFKIPGGEEMQISWKNLLFLADALSREKETVFSQYRFGGADYINIPLLCDQLTFCEKQKSNFSKKDVKRLYEIKKMSL